MRGFTQDDAHIYCTPAQAQSEIQGVLALTRRFLATFGLVRYTARLSTRPKDTVGSDADWEMATDALRGALEVEGMRYTVDEGAGAFYGPKIDIAIFDALDRTWQCSTIQCDFNMPSRFNLEYHDSSGERQTPVMIHRAIFGSLERFIGLLLEHYAGDLPLWLAPTQLRLLPVHESAVPYCEDIVERGRAMGLRVDLDRTNERLNKRIRSAELEKMPW